MADKALRESLGASLTYGFFRRVMDAFCRSAPPELPPQQEPEKTTVALICEATSKLFGVDHHPMSRVLGFGAKYLQDKFPMWISRNIDNVSVLLTLTLLFLSGYIISKTMMFGSHEVIFFLSRRRLKMKKRSIEQS